MSLGKLASTGFPVPDGFHITTDAYRRFVSANDLQPRTITVDGTKDTITLGTARGN